MLTLTFTPSISVGACGAPPGLYAEGPLNLETGGGALGYPMVPAPPDTCWVRIGGVDAEVGACEIADTAFIRTVFVPEGGEEDAVLCEVDTGIHVDSVRDWSIFLISRKMGFLF
ncbi:hypothetical protein BJX76DRAFT_321927 [Aspergillus varians]